MKALITGIEGFVGPHLNSLLVKEGFETFGTYHSLKTPPKNFHHMDITDKEQVLSVIKEVSPDYIFHLAGFSSVSKSFEEPDKCMKVNVEGTRNILDAVLNLHLKTKILVVGSAEVYGKPQFIPMTEKHPLSARTPYGESRIKQEVLCDEYVKKHRLFIVISRGFNHTGPGQQDLFVIPSFAKQIVSIERGMQECLRVGNLDVVRDFSDVRDVVRAYYLLLKKGRSGERYNVCSGEAYILKDLLSKLVDISGSEIRVETDKERMRSADIPALVGDNTKLKEATGWKPEIGIDKTLRDVLDYWRESLKK